MDRVKAAVEACGYVYNVPPDVVPNSHKALQVTELARELGLHEEVHTRLMHGYWSEAANIGDEDVLLGLCAEVGLGRSEAVEALAAGTYVDRIAAATREANSVGIHAIPAFVLDRKLLLLGAYPHEAFEQAFDQIAGMGADPPA